MRIATFALALVATTALVGAQTAGPRQASH